MDDGIRVGELGERVPLDSSTLAGIIDKMERSGYVERRPNPETTFFPGTDGHL